MLLAYGLRTFEHTARFSRACRKNGLNVRKTGEVELLVDDLGIQRNGPVQHLPV